MSESRDDLLAYHERSKHQVNRYAPGPGRLDWSNQPNPFREFTGAPRTSLLPAADSLTVSYNDVRRGTLPAAWAVDVTSLGILFELSLGLSAWKSHGGNRWALRCNPSSGNLHPTEGYLLCPSLTGLAAGVHHYVSRDHLLEQRASVDDPRWNEAFAGHGVLVGLSSIFWREAWKYGMRAWRYCQHDCGHAIAAVSYAAAALGWQTRVLVATADDTVASLLGVDRSADFASAEAEAPETVLWVGDPDKQPDGGQLRGLLQRASWHGRANRLSREHVLWPDIDRIHRATHKPATAPPIAHETESRRPPAAPAVELSFVRIARQRRSAVDFDGITSMGSAAFYAMLECLFLRRDTPPWNAMPPPILVHPAIMVHRVDGLDPGLYLLLRDSAVLADLKVSMRDDWLWQKTGPDALPLYFLLPHDLREAAKWICCHQEIGADSCFALGMIAHLHAAMDEPWRYRHLYWECGMLGQVLYLEAEAAGVRSTGIGCFFDDEMHGLLGLDGRAWQSLYHFTMGGAVNDPRLSTLPPYAFQP